MQCKEVRVASGRLTRGWVSHRQGRALVSEVVEEPVVQAAGRARTLQTARQQAGRGERKASEGLMRIL
jgi:hypothetical protein